LANSESDGPIWLDAVGGKIDSGRGVAQMEVRSARAALCSFACSNSLDGVMVAYMKIEYDPVHDLLNIEFLSNVEIDKSLELDGIVLDYAKDKRIVAIEVLDASKRTSADPLHLIDVAIVREAAEP
jgi:uncharacterized protein YuzE